MWLLTPGHADQADDHAAAAAQERSLAQLGVSPEALAKADNAAPQADQPPFAAWAWHLDAMRVFGAMRTQWRLVPAMTGFVYVGLEYASLPVVKRELGFKGADRQLFEQLQGLERGGMAYLNRSPGAA